MPLAAVLITTVLFYGAHRIRAPAEPAIVVLAAAGIVAVVDRPGAPTGRHGQRMFVRIENGSTSQTGALPRTGPQRSAPAAAAEL